MDACALTNGNTPNNPFCNAHTNLYIDLHAHVGTIRHTNPNIHRYECANVNRNTNGDGDSHPNRNAYFNGLSHRLSYPYGHIIANEHFKSDSDT